jgi:hypothetical protein
LGLRAHVRINLPGVITDFRLTSGNVHDLEAAEDIFDGVHGWVLGDRRDEQHRTNDKGEPSGYKKGGEENYQHEKQQ